MIDCSSFSSSSVRVRLELTSLCPKVLGRDMMAIGVSSVLSHECQSVGEASNNWCNSHKRHEATACIGRVRYLTLLMNSRTLPYLDNLGLP